jgi:hypothetical protein
VNFKDLKLNQQYQVTLKKGNTLKGVITFETNDDLEIILYLTTGKIKTSISFSSESPTELTKFAFQDRDGYNVIRISQNEPWFIPNVPTFFYF